MSGIFLVSYGQRANTPLNRGLQEVAYAPTVFEKADAADTAGEDGEAVKSAPAASASLPKTASPIYLIGLMGLLLVACSLVARRFATRMQ